MSVRSERCGSQSRGAALESLKLTGVVERLARGEEHDAGGAYPL